MSLTLALGSVLLAIALQEPQGSVRTVATVNLDRYAGDWFEVAAHGNGFEVDRLVPTRQ